MKTIQQRVSGNRYLAANLRSKLSKGYPATSTFFRLVRRLSDEEIIHDYIEHGVTQTSMKTKIAKKISKTPFFAFVELVETR